MDLEKMVQKIIRDVSRKGDSALFAYTKRFDRFPVTAKNIEDLVPPVVILYPGLHPVGEKEEQNRTVNVRHYRRGQEGEISVDQLAEKLKKEIAEKTI